MTTKSSRTSTRSAGRISCACKGVHNRGGSGGKTVLLGRAEICRAIQPCSKQVACGLEDAEGQQQTISDRCVVAWVPKVTKKSGCEVQENSQQLSSFFQH